MMMIIAILRRNMMNTIFSDVSLYIQNLVDLFYKMSMIIALFYATKALRVYIDKNSKNTK